MKTIRVVAAVICDSIKHKTKIFSTARGYGELKGGWEFPGGKIEAGETPQQAVIREIREELDATVRVEDLIDTIECDYLAFHLSMDCFWCEVVSGELKLLEVETAKGLTKDELDSVQWFPADVTLMDKIRNKLMVKKMLNTENTMSHTTRTQLQEGLTTAYIDGTAAVNLAYKPAFGSNNPKEGKKVISVIEDELMKCDQFQISVAFITMDGITPLLQTLKELEKRKIPGQILTTNYLNFSEPRALKKLQELSNVTLKMYDVDRADQGFHTKGYIFKKEEIYCIIIGSSNITSAALTKNKKWNTKIVSTEQGEIAMEIVKEFHQLWDSKYALFYDDFYDNYKQKYEIIKKQREIAKRDEISSTEKYKLEPNSMQVGFITNLRRIMDAGENRALLISANGTGKTYASAFAMRELGFKRVLFLIHRSTLAKQALTSFRKVFEDKKSMGIVGAGYLDYEADYIFAMVETLHKADNLRKFDTEEFDCIVLDDYAIIGLSQEAP